MARISTIELHIQTGDLSGAGTDGDIYLGLCGREFYIDSQHDDFERGASRTYVLGDGSNVLHPEFNDPREPVLFTEYASHFPAYIRFHPRSREDNWQLQRADVRFNGSLHIDWDTVGLFVNAPKLGIWLGVHAGLVAHLVNHSHGQPADALLSI